MNFLLFFLIQVVQKCILGSDQKKSLDCENLNNDENQLESNGLIDWMVVNNQREPVYATYTRYMAKFMSARWLVRSTQAMKLNVNQISCEPNLVWINSLIGRILWDVLREPYWLDHIKNRIQAKLKKIHVSFDPINPHLIVQNI